MQIPDVLQQHRPGHDAAFVANQVFQNLELSRQQVDPLAAARRRARYEVELEVAGPTTQRSVLDALEARYPMLRGTIRDQVTQQRRPFLRFFACEEDLSHEAPDAPLPEAVISGKEPLIVIGAIAGG